MIDLGRFAMSKPSSPIDQHVGERIRQQRNGLGLSLEAMANVAGLTSEQLQKYENGDERVAAAELLRIAKVLAVSPVFFFNANATHATTDGNAATSGAGLGFGDPGEGLELNRAFSTIRDCRMRKLIVDLVAVLARTEAAARGGVVVKFPEHSDM